MNRMWASQYANNHKGFCIEYEVPEYSGEYVEIFHNLFPVIYSDVRTSVLDECIKYMEDKSDEKLVENIYKYGILTKSIDWKDQGEWRLVSVENMLAEVVFGYKILYLSCEISSKPQPNYKFVL